MTPEELIREINGHLPVNKRLKLLRHNEYVIGIAICNEDTSLHNVFLDYEGSIAFLEGMLEMQRLIREQL